MIIIDKRSEIKSRAFKFVEELDQDIAIVGRNKYGISLQQWLAKQNKNLIGYIDDYTADAVFNNLPVIKSDSDLKKIAVINCIVEGRTIDVQHLIHKINTAKSIDYFALQSAFSDELLNVDFLENTDLIVDEKALFTEIYHCLEDEVSRTEYQSLLNFRLNRDIQFLNAFKFRLKEQYFEPFLKLASDPTFIDGGGYNAETTLEFIKNWPDYTRIYYFEPATVSMKLSKERLKDYPSIDFYKKGLWSIDNILHFENNLGSANRISESGNEFIKVTSIDKIVNEKVDLIKLDIEGAEMEALKGAENTIRKYKPKLAVCVYHKQRDFIDIPELVLSYNPNYEVYLRHYTQGVFESVMYFV